MNYFRKNTLTAALIAVFIIATLLLAGCGDNELVKGVTDIVKKSIGGEITKQVGDVKKQFDQIINLGTGKGKQEDGQGDAKAGTKKSEKDSGKESKDEKD
jgi:hypothetical protein